MTSKKRGSEHHFTPSHLPTLPTTNYFKPFKYIFSVDLAAVFLAYSFSTSLLGFSLSGIFSLYLSACSLFPGSSLPLAGLITG